MMTELLFFNDITHLVIVVTQSPAELVVVHAGFILAGAP